MPKSEDVKWKEFQVYSLTSSMSTTTTPSVPRRDNHLTFGDLSVHFVHYPITVIEHGRLHQTPSSLRARPHNPWFVYIMIALIL